MSVNWHYFKQITKQTGQANKTGLQTAKPVGTSQDLVEFTGYMVDQRKQTKTGRAWRAEELRLKNHSDLHKLWYVLLKEKNKLKSDFLMCKQLQQVFYGYNDLTKVALSMARLLTVVNERKRLRSQYRFHLEQEYIKEKKAEELQKFEEHREALRAKGVEKLPPNAEETKKHLLDHVKR